MREGGTFDYVIVGAGSAGCVLANRLSADPRNRVLLLEAGGEDTNPWVHVPLGYGKLFLDKSVNWSYSTEPEPELDGRRIFQPRGKVLGGSSSINGLVYIRGQQEDFDGWRQLGNAGWGFDDVLPYFIRSEDQARGADDYHGVGGPQAVSDQCEPHELCDAFIAAAAEAGHPVNPDFNGATQEGAGYYQTTSRNGVRRSTAVSYLRPARRRPNLKVVTRAMTSKVLFEGRRAAGVEWTSGAETFRAGAEGEVLLCAGAINTPQLLQLSGVGPGALLQDLGVPVVREAAGVGENLMDHLQVRCVYRCARPVTFNDDLAALHRTLWVGLRYLLQRKGPLTVSAGYAGGFFRTDPRLASPDIQVHFINFSLNKMGDKLDPFSGFTASSCPLRPESRGWVRATAPDHRLAPAIFGNYLSTEADRAAHVAGVRLIRDIMGRPAIAPYVAEERAPGADVTSDEGLLAYVRASARLALPSDRHGQDGPRRRGGGRRGAAGKGRRRPARRRRLDHADPGLGQHQRGHHHDRGEGLRPGPGRGRRPPPRRLKPGPPMYPQLALHIGGRFLGGEGRTGEPVLNPATGEVLAELPHASARDLDDAIDAAAAAFRTWRGVSPRERGRILSSAAALIRDRRETIARVMTLEQGKTLAEALGEIAYAAEVFDWYAEEGRRAYGRVVPGADPQVRQLVLSAPVGPAAAFTPWNFPALTPARKIAGALAAGCTLVLKAAEETPGTALELVRALHDAGLPPGVLNLVFGVPSEVSRRLIESDAIRKVSFTGSTAVGRQLAGLAGERLKRTTMELGGNAPVLVFADADVDRAAAMAAAGKYRNAGQICIAPSRFYVQEAVYDRFVEGFVGAAAALRVDDGLKPGAQMGPLANARRVEAMERLIEDAAAHGGKVRTGGKRLGNAGYFFAPTVVTDLTDEALLLREETFGPIAPITPFHDFDDAIARANGVPLGLAAYAFTGSARTAQDVSDALEAGMVGINTLAVSTPETPFGGWKESGHGQEGGIEGLQAYLEVKFVAQA